MPTDNPPFARSIATHAVTGLVSGAVVLAASAMLAREAPAGGPAKVKPPTIGPMVVSKLIVMDGEGRARIVLDCEDDRAAVRVVDGGVVIEDANRSPAIVLSHADQPGPKLWMTPTKAEARDAGISIGLDNDSGRGYLQIVGPDGQIRTDLPAREF